MDRFSLFENNHTNFHIYNKLKYMYNVIFGDTEYLITEDAYKKLSFSEGILFKAKKGVYVLVRRFDKRFYYLKLTSNNRKRLYEVSDKYKVLEARVLNGFHFNVTSKSEDNSIFSEYKISEFDSLFNPQGKTHNFEEVVEYVLNRYNINYFSEETQNHINKLKIESL